MKIICAGFPKTGTKSMANALASLGYSVHDFEEHLEYNFFEGHSGSEIFTDSSVQLSGCSAGPALLQLP